MAAAASKSASIKSKKRKTKPDGFLIYLPLVAHGNVGLPVLNTFNNCICFTSRERLNLWKDHYQMELANVKKYDSIAKVPRMIQAMMLGRRPKGLALDPDPITANQFDLAFVSKASDYALTDDIQLIVSFVKTTAKQTEKKPEKK